MSLGSEFGLTALGMKMASSTTERCSLRTLPSNLEVSFNCKEIADVCNVCDAPRIAWLMSSAQEVWRDWTCVRQSSSGWWMGTKSKKTTSEAQSNLEACSSNHCCSRKAISIICSECVFVALVIKHTTHLRYIVMRVLSGSTIFLHIISKTARVSEKKNFTEHKIRVLISSTFLPKIFLILRRIQGSMIKKFILLLM